MLHDCKDVEEIRRILGRYVADIFDIFLGNKGFPQ